MNALEKLWSLLYDCIAVKVNDDYLSFPAEWEDGGILVNLDYDGSSVIIYKNSTMECAEVRSGSFGVSFEDGMGKQTYEITPLFPSFE